MQMDIHPVIYINKFENNEGQKKALNLINK